MQENNILEVSGLTTEFHTLSGTVRAVNDVSFSLRKGETLGIVGESGCGKSVTALSIMRLLDRRFGHAHGEYIRFQDQDLLTLSDKQIQNVRGNEIAMIFQEPMTALNPVFSIGNQIGEALEKHLGLRGREKKQRCIELLRSVNIPRPEKIVTEYPHQLSGGMRQRVMIAMALSCHPCLLIADEPTTALDVTIQAQILELLQRIIREQAMSVMFITHDLGVIAEMADRVIVMYAGRIMEVVPVRELFAAPAHPYTIGLLHSRPSLVAKGHKLTCIPGMVPSLLDMPPGCPFADRCPRAEADCRSSLPELREIAPGHAVRCFHA